MKHVLSMAFLLSALVADAQVATFKDSKLDSAVREFVYGADAGLLLTQDQLNHVTLVSSTEGGVQDLSGLETCPNIETIYLADAQISDLTPLAKLRGSPL
jgi:hypothetical protein